MAVPCGAVPPAGQWQDYPGFVPQGTEPVLGLWDAVSGRVALLSHHGLCTGVWCGLSTQGRPELPPSGLGEDPSPLLWALSGAGPLWRPAGSAFASMSSHP